MASAPVARRASAYASPAVAITRAPRRAAIRTAANPTVEPAPCTGHADFAGLLSAGAADLAAVAADARPPKARDRFLVDP